MEVTGNMLTKMHAVFFAILIIMLASQLSWGANGRIEGKVTEASTGEPLPGATVQLEGTSLGAATDLGGKYAILSVPAGSYTLKASYIGCKTLTIKIQLNEDEQLEENIKLEAIGVTAKEVVVAAQASGQNAAINQQLTSNNVVNVVSSARIQSLPDMNAAESVGRLPGISLVRSAGEATEVVIRGLQPQYNMITVDGVPIPANDPGSISNNGSMSSPYSSGGRGVDLRMISSNTLEGVEVYKTVTPDMDAAVLGGIVNFDIREAKGTLTGAPSISLVAQGAYNGLMSTFNDYKFVASVEKRFSDDRLGIFVQGIAQRQNLTSDQFGANYTIPNLPTNPEQLVPTVVTSLNLYFYPRVEQRYDGTLTLDYRLPDGKIELVNLLSQGNTNTQYHSETYDLGRYGAGDDILYGTQYTPNTLNLVTSILHYEQTVSTIKIDAKASFSYSDNNSPNNWFMQAQQTAAQTINIPNNEDPKLIAQAGQALLNVSQMALQNCSTWDSFSKQRDIAGSVDLERVLNLSDFTSITLKAGGMYRNTDRFYNYDYASGNLYGNFAVLNVVRGQIIAQNPWMAQRPYSLNPNGAQDLPITMFLNPGMKFGNFLNGDYVMNSSADVGLLKSAVMDPMIAFYKGLTAGLTGGVNPLIPQFVPSLQNDYSGNEQRSAGYLMATVNIGPQIAITPGVRYQGFRTSYKANRFVGNADAYNPYPATLPYKDTTAVEYHGYWLPDVNLKYDPFTWLSLRAAYTNTLVYPDFNQIIPLLDVGGNYVNWNNPALKPSQSHNYDVQVSAYNNEIGLLAVSPFLKQIDDLIFYQGTHITNPSKYPGVPSYTKGYSLYTNINNPDRVNLWGVETEWQTHFWYLPYPFDGLVLNVNYTHIFSQVKYPYTITHTGGYPPKTTYADTFYTARLLQQPNDVVNLSIGYDYGKFSILASMIYQAQVYSGTNFYNSYRSDKAKYVRWDLAAHQGLPWFGLEAFLDISDLNSENDIYTDRGSGFPTSESDYGMVANLGLKWTLQ